MIRNFETGNPHSLSHRICWSAIFIATLMGQGCQHLNQRTSRSLEGLEKVGHDGMYGHSRPIRNQEPPPVLYEKESGIEIVDIDDFDRAGSLFNPDHSSAFLYGSPSVLKKGQVIDVEVEWMGQDSGANLEPGVPKDNVQNEVADVDEKAQEALSEEEKQVLASIPELAPSESKKKPLRNIKFRVLEVLANGDFLVGTKRRTESFEGLNQIEVQATVPRLALMGKDTVKTSELIDVKWSEVQNGERIKHESMNWNDEYGLRLSGFNEMNSRYAEQLRDKEQQLTEARQRMISRLNSLGRERLNIAETRSQVEQAKTVLDQGQAESQKRIAEKDEVIEAQKKQIQELQSDQGKESQ